MTTSPSEAWPTLSMLTRAGSSHGQYGEGSVKVQGKTLCWGKGAPICRICCLLFTVLLPSDCHVQNWCSIEPLPLCSLHLPHASATAPAGTIQ